MKGPFRFAAAVLLVGLFVLAGCGDYVPKEPTPNTGTVFQQPRETVVDATRNALTQLGFAITIDSPDYIEAVHLKPGETVESNSSELVGAWFKDKGNTTLLLLDTAKRPSGIAKQREWEQDILRKVIMLMP